ncbi:hypothetical protein KNP414_04620 [Paenibacillus mucilaginosus KNP414]|uniref:Uncharacterized protein n=1 Tax=Paenibacillus mucilaginosus (strain KNP414) TaxID=1036673 RepID=F8FDV0_PAEMK|nr:hypothetical protein KNP414_04620 [Paenibacillus mucilaginosus KNP414]
MQSYGLTMMQPNVNVKPECSSPLSMHFITGGTRRKPACEHEPVRADPVRRRSGSERSADLGILLRNAGAVRTSGLPV